MKKLSILLNVLIFCSLAVYGQATKTPIGSTASFSAQEGDNYHYQWMESQNNGKSFNNITDGGIYTGAKTKKLVINPVTESMDNYQYKCTITIEHIDTITTIIINKKKNTPLYSTKAHKENVDNKKVDTLQLTTAISGMDGFIQPGNTITLKSATAPVAGRAYQWQYDDGSGFQDIDKSTGQTYVINKADCNINNRRYHCKVTMDGNTITSDIDTLRITGCIAEINNYYTTGSATSFAVSNYGKGLSYQWQVKLYNSKSDYVNIDAKDSAYTGSNKDTLVIKSTKRYMNLAGYRCIISKSNTPLHIITDPTPLRISGPIGNYYDSKFQFFGALYSGIKNVQDDNAANFTQVYIRSNIYFKDRGLDINQSDRLVWWRNLFFQYTYTTNAEDLKYLNTQTQTFIVQDTAMYRSVNRLDLLKNATHNATFTFPVLTWMVPEYSPNFGDFVHLYAEAFGGMLITKIRNSQLPDTSSPLNIYSLQYGVALGSRTECLSPFTIEMSVKLFQIGVLSNSISPGLNFQERKVLNDYTPGYSRDLTSGFNPLYFNFDGLIIYNTGKSNLSNAFLHFSWFSNFANVTARHPYTTYWQLQAGYAVDINSFFTSLKK